LIRSPLKCTASDEEFSVSNLNEPFAGGVAVITGSAGGLGAGLARHAALNLGMTVILLDVDAAGLEKTRNAILGAGGRAISEVADVRDSSALKSIAAKIETEVGPVRLLVNNAGVEQFSYIWDTPERNWDRLVDVNVNGVFYGIRAFIPAMLKRKDPGWIWNVASAASFCAAPFQGAYIMSKHAVLALTECLYQEVLLADAAHIHVSAILPGGIETRIFEDAGGAEEAGDTRAARQALEASLRSRPGVLTPDEAAKKIFEQGANGEFYIATHDEIMAYMKDRADFLTNRKAPRQFDRAMFTAEEGFTFLE
jgi:NAD(P)-dependent dehydrogenase (short-subunit alcohol dehydrogenase family)